MMKINQSKLKKLSRLLIHLSNVYDLTLNHRLNLKELRNFLQVLLLLDEKVKSLKESDF